MIIANINLKKTSPEQLLKNYREGLISISKKERESLFQLLKTAINNGDFVLSLNAAALGLLVYPKDTWLSIRRKGMFRYSAYIGRKCIIKELAVALLKFADVADILDEPSKKYLGSIVSFGFISKEYVRLKQLILKEFNVFNRKYQRKSLLKTLLVYADLQFFIEQPPDPVAKEDMHVIGNKSPEDICSAVSYLIYLLSTTRVFTDWDGGIAAGEFISGRDIEHMVIAACLIEDYKEFEVMIDHYDYYIEQVDKTYTIKPPSPSFEKDMRLGYMRTDTQIINNGLSFVRNILTDDMVTLDSVADSFLKHITLEFRSDHDVQRYRLMFEETLFVILSKKLFNDNALFAEEAYHLSWIFKEQLLDLADLKDIYVSENLNLLEFLKIKRYFIFMQTVYYKKLQEVQPKIDEALFNTLAVQCSLEQKDKLPSRFIKPEMMDEFLDLMCWEQNDEFVLDLQYRPIIFLQTSFLVPFNIIAKMNVIRNLYASEYKRQNKKLMLDGSVDPLTDHLSSFLSAVGIKHIKQFIYAKGELDLVVFFDDILILIECKHSLHPATTYEMRTTYDYVQKAVQQLDRALDNYQTSDLKERLARSLNIDPSAISQVVTLIVTSNRVLHGNTFSHPVRSIYEVTNYFEKGTFTTNQGIFRLRDEGKLKKEDFLHYLKDDHMIYQHMLSVMETYTKTYHTPFVTLQYQSYFVNMITASEKLDNFTDTLIMVEKFDSGEDLGRE